MGAIMSGISGAQGGFESMSDNQPSYPSSGGDEVGSIVSGITGMIGQRQSNEQQQEDFWSAQQFNANQADLNRQFQAQQQTSAEDWMQNMSDTAMQRRVADLNAAGLNPLLAIAQGGASTPGISAPGGSSASSPGVPNIQSALGAGTQSAISAYQAGKQADLIDAQKDNLNAAAEKTRAETPQVAPIAEANIANTKQQTTNLIQAARNLVADYDLTQQNIQKAVTDNSFRAAFDDLTNKAIDINNQRLKLGMPELAADAKFWSGPESAIAAAAKAGHQGGGALGGLIGGGAQAVSQGMSDWGATATDWTSRKMESVINWFSKFLPQGHWTNNP